MSNKVSIYIVQLVKNCYFQMLLFAEFVFYGLSSFHINNSIGQNSQKPDEELNEQTKKRVKQKCTISDDAGAIKVLATPYFS